MGLAEEQLAAFETILAQDLAKQAAGHGPGTEVSVATNLNQFYNMLSPAASQAMLPVPHTSGFNGYAALPGFPTGAGGAVGTPTIFGIPGTPSTTNVLGYSLLIYGGWNMFRGRRNLTTIGALLGGLYLTGMLKKVFNWDDRDPAKSIMNLAVPALFPQVAMMTAVGLAPMLLNKLFKGGRRTTRRRSYARYAPRRRYYRRRY